MIDWESQMLRSLLFAPASDDRKLVRVGTFGADAIVLDLEDAVADAEKEDARAAARLAVPGYDAATVVAVRVNSVTSGLALDDVAATVTPGLDAIVLPKVEDTEALATLDAAIAAAERAAGMADGTVRLLALIETALGLVRCETILAAAPPRLQAVIFGSGDFSADVGVEAMGDATELVHARSRLVIAARAARLPAPIDGPWMRLDDSAGLAADCVRSRRLGFQGRVVIHPSQLTRVHLSYTTLDAEEVTQARRVVAAFEEAERRGVAAVRVDGRFVDYPIYRRAREQLRRQTVEVEG